MTTAHHEVKMPAANEILLITSGDLRLSANQVCWPAQRDMEAALTAAFAQKGFELVRAHAYDENSGTASSLRSARARPDLERGAGDGRGDGGR